MSKIIYRAASAVAAVGDLEFEGNAASPDLLADGFALDMGGANLDRLKDHGPLLWGHNPDQIIGRITSIRATTTGLPFRATFPPPGASALADEKRNLVKSGIINSVSLGFGVDEAEPITPGRPRDGIRAVRWTVYELSLVSVPADPKAVITARQRRPGNGAPAAAQDATIRRLFVVAAELGETITVARAAQIVDEARRIGRTPDYHLRWTVAARQASNADAADFLARQRDLRDLAR